MNEEEIMKKIEKVGQGLQRDLNLEDWNITYTLKKFPIKINSIGTVRMNVEKRIAEIFINNEENKSDKEILITLAHEYYHILLRKIEKHMKLGKDLREGITDKEVSKLLVQTIKEIDAMWDDLGKIVEMFRDLDKSGELKIK